MVSIKQILEGLETENLDYSVEGYSFDYNNCNVPYEDCTKYTLGICTNKIKFCL